MLRSPAASRLDSSCSIQIANDSGVGVVFAIHRVTSYILNAAYSEDDKNAMMSAIHVPRSLTSSRAHEASHAHGCHFRTYEG